MYLNLRFPAVRIGLGLTTCLMIVFLVQLEVQGQVPGPGYSTNRHYWGGTAHGGPIGYGTAINHHTITLNQDAHALGSNFGLRYAFQNAPSAGPNITYSPTNIAVLPGRSVVPGQGVVAQHVNAGTARRPVHYQLADTIHSDLQNRIATHTSSPFSADWYKNHPHAWLGGHDLPASFDAWQMADWASITKHLAISPNPIDYNFGPDYWGAAETFRDGQPAGEIVDFREPATKIADSTKGGAKPDEWLPLGVYALIPSGQNDTNMVLQLSLSKQGDIQGSYFNPLTDASQQVSGALDAKSQLVAWKIGTQKSFVMETGLSSLTKNQSTMLAHFNDGWSQIWTMIRVNKPSNSPAAAAAGSQRAASQQPGVADAPEDPAAPDEPAPAASPLNH